MDVSKNMTALFAIYYMGMARAEQLQAQWSTDVRPIALMAEIHAASRGSDSDEIVPQERVYSTNGESTQLHLA